MLRTDVHKITCLKCHRVVFSGDNKHHIVPKIITDSGLCWDRESGARCNGILKIECPPGCSGIDGRSTSEIQKAEEFATESLKENP